MYYTYIMYSRSIDRYYVGSTQNVSERLRRHNADHSKSTKGKGTWIVVQNFPHQSRSDAMKLELKIKKRGIKRYLEDLRQSG